MCVYILIKLYINNILYILPSHTHTHKSIFYKSLNINKHMLFFNQWHWTWFIRLRIMYIWSFILFSSFLLFSFFFFHLLLMAHTWTLVPTFFIFVVISPAIFSLAHPSKTTMVRLRITSRANNLAVAMHRITVFRRITSTRLITFSTKSDLECAAHV